MFMTNIDCAASFKGLAQRLINAENAFLDYAQQAAGLSQAEAEAAMSYMRKGGKRAPLKLDAVNGSFTFSHGAFGDADVLRRAAALGAK